MKASPLKCIRNLPSNIIKSLVNIYVDNTTYGSTSKNQDYRTLAADLFSEEALTVRFRLNDSNTSENASSHHPSQILVFFLVGHNGHTHNETLCFEHQLGLRLNPGLKGKLLLLMFPWILLF